MDSELYGRGRSTHASEQRKCLHRWVTPNYFYGWNGLRRWAGSAPEQWKKPPETTVYHEASLTVHKCYVSVISGNVQKKSVISCWFSHTKKKEKKRTPKMIRLLAQTYTSVSYKTNLILDVIHSSIINLVILYPDSMFFLWREYRIYSYSAQSLRPTTNTCHHILLLLSADVGFSVQLWLSVLLKISIITIFIVIW